MKRRNVFKLLAALALAPSIIIPKEVVPRVPWKLESIPELISLHGMDAEKELTKMLSEEMRKEIDKEILKIDKEILKKYNRPINKNYYAKVHIKANEIYAKQGGQKTNFMAINDATFKRLQ